MNKDDMRRRDEAIEAFMGSFSMEFRDAVRLVDKLMALGRRAGNNAVRLCNEGDYRDKSDIVVKAVSKALNEAGVDAKFKVGGDPRGYCLKIMMPDGRCNSFGGPEEGWGF